MIDTFALAITHALLALAAWRIMQRPDLDQDEGEPAPKGWGRKVDPHPEPRPDA